MNKFLCVIAALLLPVQAVWADDIDQQLSIKGFGTKGYVWGKMTPERAEALMLNADAARGKEAYRGCRGCHKPDAAGVIDGTYPRLGGQHINVLIKQMVDTREGVRINPKMLPFVEDPAVTVQEIADIALYLSRVQSPRESGKAADNLSVKGKKLYEDKNCASCHGKKGEGNNDRVIPVIANQHFGYLLRELKHIQHGTRGNSHPDMVEAISKFSHEDLEAVADYLARLPDYRAVNAPAVSKKK